MSRLTSDSAARRPTTVGASGCVALVLIDAGPLHHAAWSKIHGARKRHEKAARDLQRHEEVDTPAYEAWLHNTFPVLVTTLRELLREVSALRHEVDSVKWMGALTGRSLKKLWRERKEDLANAAADDDYDPANDSNEADRQADNAKDSDAFFEDDGRARETDFNEESSDEDQPARRLETAGGSATSANDARDRYRRLVQHLHPDRGGIWTPARERLWHEVQHAWNARDADWLARLEIDWDTANDTLSPDSPLSRLLRAIESLRAAHADTERKLRSYRLSHAWRFTLAEKKRPVLHRRVEAELLEDIGELRRQFVHLEATIAAWETPVASASSGRRRRLR